MLPSCRKCCNSHCDDDSRASSDLAFHNNNTCQCVGPCPCRCLSVLTLFRQRLLTLPAHLSGHNKHMLTPQHLCPLACCARVHSRAQELIHAWTQYQPGLWGHAVAKVAPDFAPWPSEPAVDRFTSVISQLCGIYLSHEFHPLHPLVLQALVGSQVELEDIGEFATLAVLSKCSRTLPTIPFLSTTPCFTSYSRDLRSSLPACCGGLSLQPFYHVPCVINIAP